MVDLTTVCWYVAQPNSKDYVGPKTGNFAIEESRKNPKVKVWRKGLKAWATADKTELGPYLEESTPTMPAPIPSPPSMPAPTPAPRSPAPAPKSKPKPEAPANPSEVSFNQATPSSSSKVDIKLPAGAAGLDLENAFKNMNFKLKKVKTKKPKETFEVNDDLDAGGMLGELAMAQSKFGRREGKTSSKDKDKKKKKKSHAPKSPEIGLPSRPTPAPATSIPKAPKPHKAPKPLKVSVPSSASRNEEVLIGGSSSKSTVSSRNEESHHKDIIKKINKLSTSDWQIKAIKKILE